MIITVNKIIKQMPEGAVVSPDTDATNWGMVSETETTMTIKIVED